MTAIAAPTAPFAAPSLAELDALGILIKHQHDGRATNIAPADLLRHGLFAGSNFAYQAERPMHKERAILQTDWLQVTVSGEQLGQREADIYASLLALAAIAKSYTVRVSRAALFERLGVSHGTNTVAQFNADLDRLQSTQIRITVQLNKAPKRRYSVRGPLIFLVKSQLREDGVLDELQIQLNPEFSQAFSGPLLYLSAAERRALRDDALAGWLQGYLRTQTKKTAFPIAELRELSGLSGMRTARFNDAMERACGSLAKLGYELTLPRAGSRIDGKGNVLVRHPAKGTATLLPAEPTATEPTTSDSSSTRKRKPADITADRVRAMTRKAEAAAQRADRLAADAKRARAAYAKSAGLKSTVH